MYDERERRDGRDGQERQEGRQFEVRRSRFLELRTLNFERRIARFSRVSHFPPVSRAQSFSAVC